MSENREFPLGCILSVTTGKLVAEDHMSGFYEILNYMTSDNLFTHQLPRAAGACKPSLLAQHPRLELLSGDDINNENWEEWLSAAKEIHGSHLPVAPLSEHEWERIDPISEAAEKIHPDRIIAVTTDD